MKLLEGIKVVELGTHISIPKAARLMAEWGATVIKVEPPRGEGWRTIGNSYGIPYDNDCNPIFQPPNAGKKSIAINLKSEQGKEIMYRLLGEADVFLTNTRMKGLKKLGFAYEDIQERFPKLIYAHFSGYGELGPEKDRPGFDIAAYWAKGGMPLEWSSKESGPCRPLPGFGDGTVATVALSGILAALYGREKTGKGEFLKTSLYGSALWFNSCGIIQAQYRKDGCYPLSRYDQPTPYHIIYQTKDDDYFFFSIPTWNDSYSKLLNMMHLENYVGDERFATLAACRENMRFIAGVFDDAFRKMTTKEVVDGFNSMDCVFEVVADPQSIPTDEQAWANGYLQKIQLENGSEVVVPTPPIQFMHAETAEFKLAPQIGGNSVEILNSMGYSQDDIDKMLEDGIITAAKKE
ncbi:CoA transferase [Lachnospiraceae bacterium OttesenSCG-928-D06]|nr:CoA transferase [Lachnospiraceae bacterium OttesenSCG-928-D06]